jgi:hypothetical protein
MRKCEMIFFFDTLSPLFTSSPLHFAIYISKSMHTSHRTCIQVRVQIQKKLSNLNFIAKYIYIKCYKLYTVRYDISERLK